MMFSVSSSCSSIFRLPIRTDARPLIINQGQLPDDVIIKGNASKVEFALESTSRGGVHLINMI